jgi:hypothetical protein
VAKLLNPGAMPESFAGKNVLSLPQKSVQKQKKAFCVNGADKFLVQNAERNFAVFLVAAHICRSWA